MASNSVPPRLVWLPDPIVVLSTRVDHVELTSERSKELRRLTKDAQRQPSNPRVGIGQVDALTEGSVERANSQAESIHQLANSCESGRVLEVDVGTRGRRRDIA